MSFGYLLAIGTVGTRCRVRLTQTVALARDRCRKKQTNAALRHNRAGSPPLSDPNSRLTGTRSITIMAMSMSHSEPESYTADVIR